MRVRIRHEITQRFEPPARNTTATVRLTPRSHDGQFILRWTLDLFSDCRLNPAEDAFGNLCHTFTLDGPVDVLTVIAEGEVETQDTTGILRGTVERFPPPLFLRQTELTEPDEAVLKLARSLPFSADDPLSFLHTLMATLKERIAEVPTSALSDVLPAGEALKTGTGCSGAVAHLFTSVARLHSIPARHISGYLASGDAGTARHWAEAYVPKIGWIGFDAGRDMCPTEEYVRLAVGLDSLDVAPLRGTGFDTRQNVRAEEGRLSARIAQAQSQGQN